MPGRRARPETPRVAHDMSGACHVPASTAPIWPPSRTNANWHPWRARGLTRTCLELHAGMLQCDFQWRIT
eukprot:3090378-Alexandrium_andersonii.AAC.1